MRNTVDCGRRLVCARPAGSRRLRIRRRAEGAAPFRQVLTGATATLLVAATAAQAARAQEPEFTATTVHVAAQPVYGLAVGELDPAHDGDEFAFLLADGSVNLLIRGESGWTATLLAEGTSEIPAMYDRPTIDIGDVHSGYPGNEIVIEGGRKMTMVYHDPLAGWSSEVVFDATEMTGGGWGARVGDIDTSHPGEEIFLIYEGVLDASFATLFSEVGGVWEDEMVYSAEVGMDSAIGETNAAHEGPEVILVTEMWPAYELLPPQGPPSGEWPKETIWLDFDNAAWVVEIADVDPALPGNECVYGTRYNNRITLSYPNPGVDHTLEVLFTGLAQEPLRTMWDIAVGDVLPDSESLEILGVDQTGSVYLVHQEEGTWGGQSIWSNATDPLHAVVAGDFVPEMAGDEILVAGESGTITLLAQSPAIPAVSEWGLVAMTLLVVTGGTLLYLRRGVGR